MSKTHTKKERGTATDSRKSSEGLTIVERRAARGFSLIELLIVVAIILVITAIAIPSLARAKRAGSESAAVGSLRGLNSMAVTYNTTWGNGFPALGVFGAAATEPDTCGEAGAPADLSVTGFPFHRNGYTFNYVVGAENVLNAPANCTTPGVRQYMLSAVPDSVGVTGNRSFCLDDNGDVHYDPLGQPIADRPTCELKAVLSSN